MMKRYLISFMLLIVFSVPFTIQADDISTPSYQVDVTQSVVDVGSSEVAAVNTASDESRSGTNYTNLDNATLPESTATMITVSQCASCHATGTNGVSGGDSIGISKLADIK